VELNRGAMLSNSCAACHGTDGNSPGAIPSIHGKSAEFIESAMIDFNQGKRPGTVMNRHALGYTDEEIRLIAEFFSTRP
jgi:sulfide dehydrogenase cytochrome subunit